MEDLTKPTESPDDNKFEFLVGGEKIDENPPESKGFSMIPWNTCKHRSRDKILTAIPKCCGHGTENIESYFCHKLSIAQLTPNHCNTCSFYEKK